LLINRRRLITRCRLEPLLLRKWHIRRRPGLPRRRLKRHRTRASQSKLLQKQLLTHTRLPAPHSG
jgi:hypothetical protein